MANSIVNDMRELKGLNSEIKRLNIQLKGIRDRKKILEHNILEYLQRNNQPGLKYDSLVVLKDQKKVHERKKLVEKKQDVVKLLQGSGIINAESMYDTIIETMKGKEEKVNTLKIKEQKEE